MGDLQRSRPPGLPVTVATRPVKIPELEAVSTTDLPALSVVLRICIVAVCAVSAVSKSLILISPGAVYAGRSKTSVATPGPGKSPEITSAKSWSTARSVPARSLRTFRARTLTTYSPVSGSFKSDRFDIIQPVRCCRVRDRFASVELVSQIDFAVRAHHFEVEIVYQRRNRSGEAGTSV